MSDLRLLPAALTLWATLASYLLSSQPRLAAIPLAACVAIALLVRQPGQALFILGVSSAGLLSAIRRKSQALAFELNEPPQFTGRALADIAPTAGDSWLLKLTVPGYPGELAIFLSEPAPISLGQQVVVEQGRVVMVSEATGIHAVTAHIRQQLRETAAAVVPGEHGGLLPGMVVGDTSLQSAHAEALYLATGLSHLSAVSGANVAIVTSMVVILCRALALGPRIQTVAAAAALLGFVLLVGLEPSVLRATVTGLVGLAAVINSSRVPPLHALCLSILVLLMADSSLALSYGFALSVAATAGIILLSNPLAQPLSRWLPPIAARALAVAIAADAFTSPIISLMTGRVPTVSVLANLLVAPATAPITVLGLIAAGLCLLPGPLGAWLITLISPFTWWIHQVAEFCAILPLASLAVPPMVVALAYAWFLALVLLD